MIFASQKSSTNLFIAKKHLPETCSRFLRMVLARGFLPLAHKLSLRAVLNTRRGNLLTTRFLSLANELAHKPCHSRTPNGVKQSHCKQHLFLDYFATLVMTKANRSPHCVRDDNLFLHLPQASCHGEA